MSLTFDIIIPAYKNEKDVLACFDGFEKQTRKDFRIHLCINGDPAPFEKALEQQNFSFPYQILFHPDKQNHGRAANRNQALPYLSAPYLLLFDSDLSPASNLLEEHYKSLRDGDLVSVGEVSYSDIKENSWAKYLSSRGKNKFKQGEKIPFQYFNAQNVAMPTTYFKGVNGMDEKISNYGGDDTELAYRIYQKFNSISVFTANAIAFGFMKKTLDEALDQMEEFGRESLRYIAQKHPDFRQIFAIEKVQNGISELLGNQLFYLAAKKIARLTSGNLQLKAIHFLVFYRIRKGFLKK